MDSDQSRYADVRRILNKLNFPGVDLQSDEQLVPWVFRPTEAVTTNEVLATGMADNDLLSPTDRLILAHFVLEQATDMPGFKALVAAAQLTILVSRATGKYVSCASHNHQLSNAFMTDMPGLLPWIQEAAARNRTHLPDDESTQDLCAHAAAQLAARYK